MGLRKVCKTLFITLDRAGKGSAWLYASVTRGLCAI
jgi:hypothetical protein